MKIILSFMLITMSMFSYAQTVSFKRGNTMTTDEISGYVYVNCRQKEEVKDFGYNCYDLALDGGSRGSIIVENGSIDADWIKLQRVGSRYIKGAKFNPLTQSTGNRFNLWIKSLTQRALLNPGLNEIKYTFSKNKVEVATGTFTVNVNEGDSRTCGTRTLWYTNTCPSSYQACSDYFYRQNYCR